MTKTSKEPLSTVPDSPPLALMIEIPENCTPELQFMSALLTLESRYSSLSVGARKRAITWFVAASHESHQEGGE